MDVWKWGSLIAFLCQNAVTPIVFRYATTQAKPGEEFCVPFVVFLQEAMKFLASVALIAVEENGVHLACQVLKDEVVKKPKDTLALGIPAVLYALQNGLLQISSAHLPAAVWQVTYQGKTLVVALMSVVLLQKQFKRVQWLAIAIMGCGIAIIQLSNPKESKQASMANAQVQNVLLGLSEVFVACMFSGFASVYFERIVKQGAVKQAGDAPQAKKASLWVQNVQLALFSMLITFWGVVVAVSTSGSDFSVLRGFTPTVSLLAFNNAFGGLLVALVIKHADNVLRSFSSALATIVATLLSVACFGFELRLGFGVGTLLVLGSTLLYGGIFVLPGDWWNSECETCSALRKSTSDNQDAQNDEELQPITQAEADEEEDVAPAPSKLGAPTE